MRAYRSPLKLFVFGVVGIVLIAAAADVMFGHWLSLPPDSTNGVLTTRGQAQQRGDLLWGGAMVVTGILLFGGSVTELIRRRPTVIVDGDGLTVDAGAAGVLIAWGSIDDISSSVVSAPYDGSIREQLVIKTRFDSPVPGDLAALHRDGDTIYVDAHDWTARVTEVALAAQGTLDHFQRMETFRAYEPPSMVWETIVDQDDAVDVPVVGEWETCQSDVDEPETEEDDA